MTQLRIPAVYMRGGTSKGVFFLADDLPTDPAARERLLLAAAFAVIHGVALAALAPWVPRLLGLWALTMLLAGEDTTANTLAWMIHLLHRHPEALRRAQDEVRQAEDGIHRRTDFVTHVREEGALGARCRFGLVGSVRKFLLQQSDSRVVRLALAVVEERRPGIQEPACGVTDQIGIHQHGQHRSIFPDKIEFKVAGSSRLRKFRKISTE